ncbi:MAG TPA: hypothetical protein VGU25_05660 [Acidobacteriaceae bacterium]|nr:hypothetical protein [Acidobacteriaceae bacterium]
MPDNAADYPTYTADQVARAARELREAAGASQEHFTAAQVVNMLADEVRLLRERGFSDQRIADLFTGFDIEVTAEDISRI